MKHAFQIYQIVLIVIWSISCVGVVVGAFMTIKRIRKCDFPGNWPIVMAVSSLIVSFTSLFIQS